MILTFGKSAVGAPGIGFVLEGIGPLAQVDGPATRWFPKRDSKLLDCAVGGVWLNDEVVPGAALRDVGAPLLEATAPLPGLSWLEGESNPPELPMNISVRSAATCFASP